MEHLYHQRSPQARWAILCTQLLITLAILVGIGALGLVLHAFHVPTMVWRVFLVVGILVSVVVLLYLVLAPTVGFARYRYRITDQSIEVISGVLSIQQEVLPIRRIQQINIQQGPILRLFGLATVELISAGGMLTLTAIPLTQAEETAAVLKEQVNAFVKEEGYGAQPIV